VGKVCFREVAGQTRADPVSALCVSSLGEAMTPVDAAGSILGHCILSSRLMIRESETFFRQRQFLLPPWAHWNLGQWQHRPPGACEIFDNMMGWDITDFGSNDFAKQGLILFTIRNGSLKKPDKPYAEKIMIVREQQITPYHFHWKKTEDIINRGGGNLVIQIYGSGEQGGFSKEAVAIMIDGLERDVPPGGLVTLTPGESICLKTGIYHSFWGEAGKGDILVGEVSVVSNDVNDNRFYEKLLRFPDIEGDVPPFRLLTSDYGKFLAPRRDSNGVTV
jgi:hypothetical protein